MRENYLEETLDYAIVRIPVPTIYGLQSIDAIVRSPMGTVYFTLSCGPTMYSLSWECLHAKPSIFDGYNKRQIYETVQIYLEEHNLD